MPTTSPLDALQARVAAVNDVLNAISVLTWDSRTMMPAGGAQTRGLQISTLTGLALELLLRAGLWGRTRASGRTEAQYCVVMYGM